MNQIENSPQSHVHCELFKELTENVRAKKKSIQSEFSQGHTRTRTRIIKSTNGLFEIVKQSRTHLKCMHAQKNTKKNVAFGFIPQDMNLPSTFFSCSVFFRLARTKLLLSKHESNPFSVCTAIYNLSFFFFKFILVSIVCVFNCTKMLSIASEL